MNTQSDARLITVIMPVLNEEAFIEGALGAVQAQDYPSNRIEIFVVDGRSADRTLEIVARMAERDPRIRLLDNPERDQASAMNVGIAVAKGEIIVRVDGHGEIAPDYITTAVRVLDESGADNVGGQMRSVGTSPLTNAIALAINSPFGTGGGRYHMGAKAGPSDSAWLGVFRRSVFDRVGLFDKTAVPNEDYEINYRIRRSGGLVYFSPDIGGLYYVRSSLRALARQYYRYGLAKRRVIVQHPRSTAPRHLAAPLLVASLILLPVLSLFFPPAWLALAAVIGLYALAVILASLLTSARHSLSSFPYLLLIFPLMHLTWGAGVWLGTLRAAFAR